MFSSPKIFIFVTTKLRTVLKKILKGKLLWLWVNLHFDSFCCFSSYVFKINNSAVCKFDHKLLVTVNKHFSTKNFKIISSFIYSLLEEGPFSGIHTTSCVMWTLPIDCPAVG